MAWYGMAWYGMAWYGARRATRTHFASIVCSVTRVGERWDAETPREGGGGGGGGAGGGAGTAPSNRWVDLIAWTCACGQRAVDVVEVVQAVTLLSLNSVTIEKVSNKWRGCKCGPSFCEQCIR